MPVLSILLITAAWWFALSSPSFLIFHHFPSSDSCLLRLFSLCNIRLHILCWFNWYEISLSEILHLQYRIMPPSFRYYSYSIFCCCLYRRIITHSPSSSSTSKNIMRKGRLHLPCAFIAIHRGYHLSDSGCPPEMTTLKYAKSASQ